MKIIAVDDERLALNNIMSLLKINVPQAEVNGFLKPEKALAYLSQNEVDVAFLDIKMEKMSGIALAKKCKDFRPKINIIFVTGYDDYAMDALRLHASGYLLKPVRVKDLLKELTNLLHPLETVSTQRVRIHTFGNFEVFVDNQPLPMPHKKCRECLAYLVDRKGASATVAELASVLWEDEPYDKRVQNKTYRVICELLKTLKDAGIAEIVHRSRTDISLATELVDCDYYRFLRGDVSQINAFLGEYMSNYGWAEFTLAALIAKKQ